MTRFCATRLAMVAALLLVFPSACATTVNPATGRREVLLMTTEEEREAQQEVEEQIQAQYGDVHDEPLAEYVEAVGAAIAEYAPQRDVEYRFHLVEMDDPNAFALPAGGIYISRGLLVLMNSEAELANVLAHEIAHVAARHAAQRHAHQATFGLATLLGDLASGGGATDAGSRRESIGGVVGIAAYGRNQEREADRIGQDLVVEAGIDPGAMSNVLRTLQSERRRQKGWVSPNSYLSTHPADIERIAETATRAQIRDLGRGAPSPVQIAATRSAFLERLEGMEVGRPAAEGIVEDNRFLHPELGFSLRFPQGWRIENANAYVMATSTQGDSLVLLTLDSEGEDPLKAAVAHASEGTKLSTPERVKIGSLDAVRARAVVESPRGAVDAELIWIAFEGRIFRLATGRGMGGLRKSDGWSRAIARTFRPLTAEERADLTELRLRVVVARGGESLAALSRRSGNEWDLHETASANGLVLGEPLEDGLAVKIARREPYRSQATGAPSPARASAGAPGERE